VELNFATPSWALVGLAVVLPLAALLLMELRATRVRKVLRLRRPDNVAMAAPAVALGLIAVLVALAAAQPVLVTREEQLVRRDAEIYVIIDISRSMLAAGDSDEATRFERAQRIAADLRRRFDDVPLGLASMSDRLLVHLFPTVDRAAYSATLERAMGIDRPPPRVVSRRATRLAAAADIGVWNFYSDTARERLAVVLTDGEGQASTDASEMRSALQDGVPVRFSFLHVWQNGEEVFGPLGAEPGYTADPASFGLVQRVAGAARGRAFREGQVAQLEAELRRRLPPPLETDVGARAKPRPLAPYAAAAAFLPLAFLVRRRNRA
jgi:hypothetical protein